MGRGLLALGSERRGDLGLGVLFDELGWVVWLLTVMLGCFVILVDVFGQLGLGCWGRAVHLGQGVDVYGCVGAGALSRQQRGGDRRRDLEQARGILGGCCTTTAWFVHLDIGLGCGVRGARRSADVGSGMVMGGEILCGSGRGRAARAMCGGWRWTRAGSVASSRGPDQVRGAARGRVTGAVGRLAVRAANLLTSPGPTRTKQAAGFGRDLYRCTVGSLPVPA